jgi:hypothetical protein
VRNRIQRHNDALGVPLDALKGKSMDAWQMAVFFGIAGFGVYKLVEGLNRVADELNEVNRCLDWIDIRVERVDPEARLRVRVEQLEMLRQISQQQQLK